MAQQTQINGNRYSHVNLLLSFANVSNANNNALQFPGGPIRRGVITALNYKPAVDGAIVQGNQVAPVGRTMGYGSSTGSVTFLVSEFNDFCQVITQGGAFPISTAEFNLTASYGINDIDTFQDDLIGCRLMDADSTSQNGNDPTARVCTLSIMRIKLNGIDFYADPQQ